MNDTNNANAGPSGLGSFFSSLATVDIYYWRGKNKPVIHIIPLLLASGVLITISRAIFFGFDDTLASLIGTFTGFTILCISSAAALLRKRAEIPNEIYHLAHTIATTWLLALTLLVPSHYKPLQWFERLNTESNWPTALTYAGVATAILLKRSWIHQSAKPKLLGRIITPLFIFSVTSLLMHAIIIDETTDSFFQENGRKLLNIFTVTENKK